ADVLTESSVVVAALGVGVREVDRNRGRRWPRRRERSEALERGRRIALIEVVGGVDVGGQRIARSAGAQEDDRAGDDPEYPPARWTPVRKPRSRHRSALVEQPLHEERCAGDRE